ncbi:hypothetical protein ACFOWM_09740 [Ferruginibacter yonginensis]|uniref:Uncharacterized protein n=1 Tax=Ferruginibacter yonginensis TaxID=1310416 RepID=A0ABV8QSC6_9BACT
MKCLVFILFVVLTKVVVAQNIVDITPHPLVYSSEPSPPIKRMMPVPVPTVATKRPLLFVDGFLTEAPFFSIDKEKIQSAAYFTKEEAYTRYNINAPDGMLYMITMPGTKLLTIGAILERYNIDNDNYPIKRICINNIIIKNPKQILLDIDVIENVYETDNVFWSDVSHANTGEQFINIQLKK